MASFSRGCSSASRCAANQSSSAVRTHSAVSFCIEHFPCCDDFAQKPISLREPLAKSLRSAHEKVHGKRCPAGHPDTNSLRVMIGTRHHDQQIHVASLSLFTARVRPEQNHL